MKDNFNVILFWILVLEVFVTVIDIFENRDLYKHIVGNEVQCLTPNKKAIDP